MEWWAWVIISVVALFGVVTAFFLWEHGSGASQAHINNRQTGGDEIKKD